MENTTVSQVEIEEEATESIATPPRDVPNQGNLSILSYILSFLY